MSDIEGEEWRPVVGYEGFYEVSSYGRVRGLDRAGVRSDGRDYRIRGKILTPGHTKNGYRVVALSRGGTTRSCNIHVLVAQAFLPNPFFHPLVRHLNDVGSDNRVQNLAWGTYSENRRDAVRSGAYVNQYASATHCLRGHKFDKENTYLIPSGGRACKACRRAQHEKRKQNGNS